MNNNIVKISHTRNVRINDLEKGFLFPMQNILKVYFENGEIRTLDLVNSKDITDNDMLQVLETPKTKEKIIF